MQTVPESVFKQILSHNQFGLGVSAPDSAHVVAPYFGFVNVGHGGDLCSTKVAKLSEASCQKQNWPELSRIFRI